jgi:hypothetical protein
MSAVAIVGGVLEGIQLLDSLIQSASTVSAAVKTAQTTGQPVDWTTILGDEGTAEASVLAAIAAAKAAGH